MVDGRKNNGGVREGQGRPSKAIEEHALTIIKKALKAIYGTDDDEDAKIAFLEEFAETSRGQLFIAEHLFGKPRDVVENINYDVGEITVKEARNINKALESEY